MLLSVVVQLGGAAAGKDGCDLALFAYLEDVSPAGTVSYVTEGQVRPSHRCSVADEAGSPQPFCGSATTVLDNQCWCPRSFRRADHRLFTCDERVDVRFAMEPVSYFFAPGHSVRVRFTGVDSHNFFPVQGAISQWDLLSHASVGEGSFVSLPIERSQ